MPNTLKLRRGTTAGNDAFTGAEGEPTYDTQRKTLRVHDGSTAGGVELAKSGAIGSSLLTMATARLLGRTTASTGAVEEITAGTGLTLSGGSLTPVAASDSAAGIIEIATQSEVEAANSATLAVVTGRQQFHPGMSKARVNFNGTGTVAIREAYNVTSITDNGTGDYTINFTNAFSNASYAAEFGGGVTSGSGQPCFQIVSQSTTACNIQIVQRGSGVLEDDSIVCVNFQGDQ